MDNNKEQKQNQFYINNEQNADFILQQRAEACIQYVFIIVEKSGDNKKILKQFYDYLFNNVQEMIALQSAILMSQNNETDEDIIKNFTTKQSDDKAWIKILSLNVLIDPDYHSKIETFLTNNNITDQYKKDAYTRIFKRGIDRVRTVDIDMLPSTLLTKESRRNELIEKISKEFDEDNKNFRCLEQGKNICQDFKELTEEIYEISLYKEAMGDNKKKQTQDKQLSFALQIQDPMEKIPDFIFLEPSNDTYQNPIIESQSAASHATINFYDLDKMIDVFSKFNLLFLEQDIYDYQYKAKAMDQITTARYPKNVLLQVQDRISGLKESLNNATEDMQEYIDITHKQLAILENFDIIKNKNPQQIIIEMMLMNQNYEKILNNIMIDSGCVIDDYNVLYANHMMLSAMQELDEKTDQQNTEELAITKDMLLFTTNEIKELESSDIITTIENMNKLVPLFETMIQQNKLLYIYQQACDLNLDNTQKNQNTNNITQQNTQKHTQISQEDAKKKLSMFQNGFEVNNKEESMIQQLVTIVKKEPSTNNQLILQKQKNTVTTQDQELQPILSRENKQLVFSNDTEKKTIENYVNRIEEQKDIFQKTAEDSRKATQQVIDHFNKEKEDLYKLIDDLTLENARYKKTTTEMIKKLLNKIQVFTEENEGLKKKIKKEDE